MFSPGIWWCILFQRVEGGTMGQILHRSATTTEAIRRAIQHSQESLRTLSRAWHQPEDGGQVEEAQFNGRSSNWSNRSQVYRLVHRAGGRHRCVSQAHALAAGRLPLRLEVHDLSPDSIFASSLSGTPWQQPAARGGRRQAQAEEVRQLSDRLLPYRSG